MAFSPPATDLPATATSPRAGDFSPPEEDRVAQVGVGESASGLGTNWERLYGGLDDLDRRLDEGQRRAISALDRVAGSEPREIRARAINQAFVGHVVGSERFGAAASNWGAVKDAFVGEVFGVSLKDASDEHVYGMIAKELSAEREEQVAQHGEIKPWTFRDSVASKLESIWRGSPNPLTNGRKNSLRDFWESINVPIVNLPRAPAGLPDERLPGQLFSPAVLGGVWNAVAPAIEGFTSPLGVATVGIGSKLHSLGKVGERIAAAELVSSPQLLAAGDRMLLAKKALGGISGLFAASMAKAAVDAAPQVKAVLDDPSATTQERVEALATPVVDGMMAVAGAFGAVHEFLPGERALKLNDRLQGKSPAQAAEILRREAATAEPRAADAMQRAAATLDEFAGYAPGPAESEFRSVGGEKIAAAAIRTPDGEVHEGETHGAIAAELGGSPEGAEPRNGLRDALRAIDEREGVDIAQELADALDELPELPPEVAKALKAYRDEARYEFEELGGRGDVEPFEDALVAAVRAAARPEDRGAPTAAAPTGAPATVDVSPIVNAKTREEMVKVGGELLANATGEDFKRVRDAMRAWKPSHGGEEGFVTSTGRFVDRTEARAIAENAGQLKPASAEPKPTRKVEGRIAASEIKVGDQIATTGDAKEAGVSGTVSKVNPKTLVVETTYFDKPMTLTIRKDALAGELRVLRDGKIYSSQFEVPAPDLAGAGSVEQPDAPNPLHSHEVDYAREPDFPRSSFGQTALKNAYGELERVAYGFPDATPTEQRNMTERWARSGEILVENPKAGEQIAERLLNDPHVGLTDDQSALLLRHKVALQNALNHAADIAADAAQSDELRSEARAQVNELSDQLLRLLDAVNRRGSEWGREGRWRQAIAKEDYSFAAQETLLRAAAGGRELTALERETLTKRVKELEAAQARYDAKIAEFTAQTRVSPPITPSRARAALSKAADEAKARLRARLARVNDITQVLVDTPEVAKDLAIIGADYLMRFGEDAGRAARALVAEFGEKIRPYVKKIVADAYDVFKNSERGRQTETPRFKAWFGESKVVDQEGKPQRVYHGTQRPDRIGSRFRKSRATSGPMPFFTDDPEIASSYAEKKSDTSFEQPSDYAGWFKFKEGRGSVDIDRAWWRLSEAERKTVLERIYTIGHEDPHEGAGPIVGGSESIMGRESIDYELRQARGNGLRALVEIWLNSGSLFNDEAAFLDVLRAAGLDMSKIEFADPHATTPAVFPVYLSIRNPLDASSVPPRVASALAEAGKRKRAKAAAGGNPDAWDKNVISGRDWLELLRADAEKGTTHAWTRIPDWATETLRGLGYDGVKDTGGKAGGRPHNVWVPFNEAQVKSAIGNSGAFEIFGGDLTDRGGFTDRVLKDPKADPAVGTPAKDDPKWLSDAGREALARMKQRLGRVSSNAPLDPEALRDVIIVGSDLLYHTGVNFTKWSARMVQELGEKITPHLREAWEQAKESFRASIRETLVYDRDEASGGNLGRVANELARGFVEDGIKDRDQLVEAVRAELAKDDPKITRREVMDAISGYGKFSPLSHDQITDQLRDLKGQLQQVAKLEDMAAGQAPRKTGVERRTPSDEERRLAREVEAKKKEGGYAVTDPERQLRTALMSVKRNLENRIKDLARELETGERAPAGKPAPTDPRAEALKALRDRIKETVEAAEGTPEIDPEERVRRAVEATSAAIERLERDLDEGKVFPEPTKTSEPWSPALVALRKQLDDLRAFRKEMQRFVRPPKTPEERALSAVKSNLKRQIDSLEKQIATRERTAKAKKATALDAEAEALKARRDQLKEQFEQVFGRPEMSDEQRLNVWKATAKRRIDDLQRRLAERDFSPVRRHPPPKFDAEAARLKGQVERLRQDFWIERKRVEEEAAPGWLKFFRTTSGVARGSAISGYHTLGKLASFSLARFGEAIPTEAVGALLRRVSGVEAVARKASMESGAEFAGLARFFTKAATDGARDALETLTPGNRGKSLLKAELGDAKQVSELVHWYDFFGVLHAAEKSPLLRAEFELRLEKLHRWALANGLDVTDPLVAGALRKEAFDYAQRSILMEKNAFSDWVNSLTTRLEASNPKTGKVDLTKAALATFVKTFLTKSIVKTPANYVMQTLERTPLGLAKGTAELVVAHMRGVEKLTPEEANAIMRLIKIGAVGSAVFAWGAIDATQDPKDRIFGGYYQPGDKRSDEDVGFGRIRVGGWEMPHVLTHNPLTESAQMGSTFYRVMKAKLKGARKTEEKGAIAGMAAALVALASEAPVVSPITREVQAVERGEVESLVWDQLAGLIPMLVQNLASDLDDGKARKATTPAEAFEKNIPGLRSDVPETKAQRERDIKQRFKK